MLTQSRLPRTLQRLTEFGIGLVVVATLFTLVVVVFTEAGLDVPIQFTPESSAYSIASDDWGSGTILSSEGLVRFTERDGGLVAIFVAAVFVYTVPSLLLLILLRRLLLSFAQGTPFVRENAVRMRWIGVLIVVFGLAIQATQSLAAVLAMNVLTTEGVHLEAILVPDLAIVFVGLVVLVLAEAFRHAADLQAEADLTV